MRLLVNGSCGSAEAPGVTEQLCHEPEKQPLPRGAPAAGEDTDPVPEITLRSCGSLERSAARFTSCC